MEEARVWVWGVKGDRCGEGTESGSGGLAAKANNRGQKRELVLPEMCYQKESSNYEIFPVGNRVCWITR